MTEYEALLHAGIYFTGVLAIIVFIWKVGVKIGKLLVDKYFIFKEK